MKKTSVHFAKLSFVISASALCFINFFSSIATGQNIEIAKLDDITPNSISAIETPQKSTHQNRKTTIRTAFLYDEAYRPVLQIISDNDDLNVAVFAHQEYAYFIFQLSENPQSSDTRFHIINKSPNLIQLPNVKGGVILRATLAPQTLARLSFAQKAAGVKTAVRDLTASHARTKENSTKSAATPAHLAHGTAASTVTSRAFEQTLAPQTFDFTFDDTDNSARPREVSQRDLVGALRLQNHALALTLEDETFKATELNERAIYFTDPNTNEKFAVFTSSLPPYFIGQKITSSEFDLLQTQMGIVLNYRTDTLNVKSQKPLL